MAEERVVLTAELRDQMSAPLETASRRVDGFTRTVETGARRQTSATGRAATAVTGSVTRQNRLFSSMTGVVGRAMSATSRLFGSTQNEMTRSLTAQTVRQRDANGRFIAQSAQAGQRAGRGMADGFAREGERAGSGFGEGLKKMLGPILAFLAFDRIKDLAGGAVSAFSELEDSSAAAGVVFGDSMQKIIDQSMTADKTLGLSQQAVINGANTFGTYGKAAGLAGDDLAGFATGLTGLAGDMASFKGTSTEQALEAIAAGLRGEAEPLRAYGVMLDDVQMRDEALRMGLIKTTKDALTPQQKVLTAQALIFKQTTDAQGDFARTSESTANIQKTLSAASENLSAKIGSVLAPAFTAVRKKMLGAVSGLSVFADKLVAAQQAVQSGGTNLEIGKALGLDGKALEVFDTGLGSVRAFFGALKDGGDDITSSGLAGEFEKWGVALRNAWDKGKEVGQWLWDMRAPIGVVAALILTLLIPRFVQLGIEALKSAAQQKLAWMIARGAAVQGAAANVFAAWAVVGAWIMMGAQATIQAVKIAAAWLIALGPIGWIVAGIALLVAGVVWAYNNIGWFRDAVDAAFKWIGEAAQNVADWFVSAFKWIGEAATNVSNWIGEAFQWVGDVFQWIGQAAQNVANWIVGAFNNIVDFWNSNVVPVLTFLGSIFGAIFGWIGDLVWNFATIAVFLFLKLVDFWNGVLMPALQGLGNFFMGILAWIYSTIVQPVIDLIVGAFRGIVDFWNGILIPAFQAVGDFFMGIFDWIYNTIIKPYIDLLVGAFGMLTDFWNNTLMPAFQAVGDFFMGIFDWIYNNIIKPYIDLIVGAFAVLTDWWNTTLKPIIDSVGGWFSDIIGGAISGVKGFIDDLVKGFGLLITFVNDKLKPIIDGMKGWFEDLGRMIGDVLGKIGEFAKNPLGGIQDMLGIKKDENGNGIMPQNSGGGVYAGDGVRFSGGGVLGGYAPGNDSIFARLSPGESVLVPELTRAIGPQNIMAANAAASGGRKAGSGPALRSGHSSGRAGSGSITVHAPIQITVHADGAGNIDYAALQAAAAGAVNDVVDTYNRRAY